MSRRADFSWQIVRGVVCVIDHDTGGASVTNDAENVIRDLVEAGVNLAAMPVIYRDSMGVWDQLVVRDGEFADFRSLGATSLREALDKLPKTEGEH